jgi:ribonuclease Z
MINWEGTRLLLDVGPGTITEIWRRGLPLRGLTALLITHGHLDHSWGLAPLLWFLHQRDWQRPITLIFPKEIEAFLEQLVSLARSPKFISLHPVTSEDSPIQMDRTMIQPFPVNHPVPSVGFLITESAKQRLDTQRLTDNKIPRSLWAELGQGHTIEHQGKSLKPQEYHLAPRQRKIIYTGDTGPSPELIQIAKNADLLIIDATWVYPQWDLPGDAPHLTLREVLEIAHKAQVQRVLLTHLTTRLTLDEYRQEVKKIQEDLQSKISIHFPDEETLEIP